MPEITISEDVAMTALLDARARGDQIALYIRSAVSSRIGYWLGRLDEADRQIAALERALNYAPEVRDRVPRHRALVPLRAA